MVLVAVVVAILAVGALPAASMADALVIEPGLWELRAEMPTSMAGAPDVRSTRRCLREREVTAEAVSARVQDCQVWDLTSNGNTASWRMRCRTPLGVLPGRGNATYTDTTVSGSVRWAVLVGGVELTTTNRFRGQRIGVCP
jgi:hypothetical protein